MAVSPEDLGLSLFLQLQLLDDVFAFSPGSLTSRSSDLLHEYKNKGAVK